MKFSDITILNHCSKCLCGQTNINKPDASDSNPRLVESDSNLNPLRVGRIWLCLEQGVSQIPITLPLFSLHRHFQTRATPGRVTAASAPHETSSTTVSNCYQHHSSVNKWVLSVHFCTACAFSNTEYWKLIHGKQTLWKKRDAFRQPEPDFRITLTTKLSYFLWRLIKTSVNMHFSENTMTYFILHCTLKQYSSKTQQVPDI